MAEEGEISKRIDDLHRRFDDLRTDLTTRFAVMDQRFDDLRTDLTTRMDQRFGDLRVDVTSRLEEITRRLDTLAAAHQSAFRWTISTVVALFGIAVPLWMWVLSLVLRPLLR